MNPLPLFQLNLYWFGVRGSAQYFNVTLLQSNMELVYFGHTSSVPISIWLFLELMHHSELIFGEYGGETWLRPSPGRRPPAGGACWVCWRSSSARAARVCYQKSPRLLKSNNKARIRNRDMRLACLDLRSPLTRSYFWQPSNLHHYQIIVKAWSFWKREQVWVRTRWHCKLTVVKLQECNNTPRNAKVWTWRWSRQRPFIIHFISDWAPLHHVNDVCFGRRADGFVWNTLKLLTTSRTRHGDGCLPTLSHVWPAHWPGSIL